MPKRDITTIIEQRKRLIAPLIANGFTLKDVADILDIDAQRTLSFKNDASFEKECRDMKGIEENVDMAEYRRNHNKVLLKFIYNELLKRVLEGELQNLKIGTLHDLITSFSKELRLDTTGEATSKEEINVISNVRDRFNRSRKQQEETEINDEDRKAQLRKQIEERAMGANRALVFDMSQK